MLEEEINQNNNLQQIIIRRGLFLLSVVFAILSCAFSLDYLRGISQNISNGTIIAVVLSILNLTGCLIPMY